MNATVAAPRIAPDADGSFTLDASVLAGHFGWPEQTLKDYMQRGQVHSRVERGEGPDAGTWRLSVRCGNRRWRAVVDAGGQIMSQTLDIVSQRTGEN